jgi:hypothetical protein
MKKEKKGFLFNSQFKCCATKRSVFISFIFLILASSCNRSQSHIDSANSEIEYAEQNKEDMTAKEWSALEKKMQQL